MAYDYGCYLLCGFSTKGGSLTLGFYFWGVGFVQRKFQHNIEQELLLLMLCAVSVCSCTLLMRLALNEVLRCCPGALVVLAPCCKSFTRMCQACIGCLVEESLGCLVQQPTYKAL